MNFNSEGKEPKQKNYVKIFNKYIYLKPTTYKFHLIILCSMPTLNLI